MKIEFFPEELIKRCVWDNYVYYVLGSDKDAEKLLKENKPFEMSERDALVIGLLKSIETSNLIHKFNSYIVDFLTNKSITNDGVIVVRKKTLDFTINKFLDKFPDYWSPDFEYKKSLSELVSYIENLNIEIAKFEIIRVTDQFGIHDYVSSNNVKKVLSFNY